MLSMAVPQEPMEQLILVVGVEEPVQIMRHHIQQKMVALAVLALS
jgi:hypothetical protein